MMMFLSTNLAFILLFFPLVNSSNLISSKYWYFTCSSNECTTAINSCLNCLGERMCKACITNTNPNCATCANDIFNKEDLENIDGIPYFVCENSDPFQSKVCHFYCRGQYSQFGQCEINQNLPYCQCSSLPTTTTATTLYNTPKLQITVSNFQLHNNGKVLVLKNGNFVRGYGSNIEIYNSTTGQMIETLTSSYTAPWVLGQLSNGLLVAGYRVDKTILIWNLAADTNEERVKQIIRINEDFQCLTILKNDDLVIGQALVGKPDLIIRNSQNGSIKQTLAGHTSWIFQIIELPNGNLVSCSEDTTVRIWNRSLSSSLLKTIYHSSSVYSIVILKNGNLASGLKNGRIEIRKFETGDLIRILNGHTNIICSINCLHELNNGDLVSASWDKTIKVWNPDGTEKLTNNRHNSEIYQLDFLPSGNLLSVSTNKIFIW